MRTRLAMVALALVLAGLLSPIPRAQEEEKPKILRELGIRMPGSNGRVSHIYHFDYDQFMKELKQVTITTARDMLKINDEKVAADSIAASFNNSRDSSEQAVLSLVFVPASPSLEALDTPAREKYVARIAEQATDMIKRNVDRQREEFVAKAKRAAQLSEAEAAEARDNLNRLRDQLRKATGRADVTPSVLRAALTSLDAERQKLLLEADATNARRTALEAVLAAAAKKAVEAATGDPVLRELEELRAARAKEVEYLKQQFKGGIVSNQEVLRAQSAEVEARVRVLERKELAARQAGGTALDDLNRQLLETSVRATEMQARLKSLQAAIDALVQSSDTADKLEDAQNRDERAASNAVDQRRGFQEAQANTEGERAEVITHGKEDTWGGRNR